MFNPMYLASLGVVSANPFLVAASATLVALTWGTETRFFEKLANKIAHNKFVSTSDLHAQNNVN